MFSKKIVKNLENASFIREMFEQGTKLAAKFGKENVYDFSIGNPYLEPPKKVIDSLIRHLTEEKGVHRYMSNAGYPEVRCKIAEQLSKDSGISLGMENIVMTVGAAGGLNVVLKSILDEGDEVIVFAPYFVEYNFYIDNHGGNTVVVAPNLKNFEPDLNSLEKAINPRTKAIIINNPNNPTGAIYSPEILSDISALLEKKEKELGIDIYVISDQPYAEIVYDGAKVENLLKVFKNAIVVNSFSKSLGLAGERIGYIAASSRIDDVGLLMEAMSFCNRTLGFVNAPGLFQKAIGDSLDAKVDVDGYKKRRDYLYDNLTRLGFEIVKPKGAFYLFPKALIEDDVEFINKALDYNLLLVPGSGFGQPGYFRMSYCVEFEMIEKSIQAFEKLAANYQSR